MKYNKFSLLIILATISSSSSYADSTLWVGGDLVRTMDGTNHNGWHGTITLDDWDFVGPNGRTAMDFEPLGGFGNGVFNAGTAATCIADPASCGIGQMQHVVTTGPDGLTQDPAHYIEGDFMSPNGPYAEANVDSLTTFYKWGYTTVAGSTFSNMLIDFDGDYHIAKDDMSFEYYSVIDYKQIVPDGQPRVGTVVDGVYSNTLGFQPYAISDAKGWCGSVIATHPNAHEAMAGQVTFDVVFDVYFTNADSSLTYWSSEITDGFQMRSFGDIYLEMTNAAGTGTQVMSARAIVNNTDPTVVSQSVGPATPVGDPGVWHNKVSFMGADVIPGGSGLGFCGIETAEWIAGQRGPGIKRFESLIPGIADTTACTAANPDAKWNQNAFAGYAYILRADGIRVPDYFDAGVYGPDPMTLDANGNGQMDYLEDTDADGVLAYDDNCDNLSNPDQQDTDADGFGNGCDADFNNDGVVNSLDIGFFRSMFFTSGNIDADLNADGVVNSLDIGLFKTRFFISPGA
ncbi:MAG: hypothetical protein OEY06_07385 [Gammaproteobacteria bacterium]|nr:hypothetical protein [Gammaproteobacteria bacterium]